MVLGRERANGAPLELGRLVEIDGGSQSVIKQSGLVNLQAEK